MNDMTQHEIIRVQPIVFTITIIIIIIIERKSIKNVYNLELGN